MKKAEQLKQAEERCAEALAKVKALTEKINTRTWSEETDAPAFEAAKAEFNRAEQDKKVLVDAMEMEHRAMSWTSTATQAPAYIKSDNLGDTAQKIGQRYSFMNAVRASLGEIKLDGVEEEMHQEAIREMPAGISYGRGVLVPQMMQQRDMLAGTTTAGGFTVQTDVERLIPFLDPRGVLYNIGATFLSGLTGNIDFPRNDAAAAAVWETEVASADETSPTFDRVQMSPKRLAAFTDVSMQILRQSTIPMENFVRNRLMRARDNALDTAALSPQSGSAPTGIVGTSGVNTISIAASPTWAKIVQFETEVAADNADFGTLAYLTTPQIAGILKQVKRDVAGNGFIWEGDNMGGGRINGYRALTSTLVPTTGGAHYMFFGNWAKLLVGQWGGMEIVANPYTKLKEATVEIVLNTWHDLAIEHGQAFAYSTSVHPS
ncbi:MAG: phage major capsid protein [Candidatus Obscuribacter sp.]|nr:phage major capsid protein [Candidatus Obscuribacter sp.]